MPTGPLLSHRHSSQRRIHQVCFFIYLILQQATNTHTFFVSGDRHGDGTETKKRLIILILLGGKKIKEEAAGWQRALVSMPPVPNLHILLTSSSPSPILPL